MLVERWKTHRGRKGLKVGGGTLLEEVEVKKKERKKKDALMYANFNSCNSTPPHFSDSQHSSAMEKLLSL